MHIKTILFRKIEDKFGNKLPSWPFEFVLYLLLVF